MSSPGRPGALLRPAPLRTGLARFPRIRLKQARADPLPQTPYVLLDGPPTNGVPVQGFVLRSVHHGVSGKHRRLFASPWCPTCPSVPTSLSVFPHRPTWPASAPFRVRALVPYLASYPQGRRRRGRPTRPEVSCRLSAT